MPQTRRSLGIPSNEEFAARKRRNSSPFKKLYPNLTEGVSYASTATTFVKTSEVQDEDDDGLETEHDSSFASSVGSERPSPDNENEPWKLVLVGILIFLLAVCIGLMVRATTSNGQSDAPYENYIKSVRGVISNQFPDLSAENRAILRLIGQKVYLEPENHAPLVILVGGANSRQFSEAVNHIIRKTVGKTHADSIRIESDTNRAELHENLKDVLGASDDTSSVIPHSAVVLDVDLLTWDAVLVLHAFADHENYPIRKTVLFLTVSERNEDDLGAKNRNCEEKMVGFLTNRWIENGGTSDNIPPIIARISYFICV